MTGQIAQHGIARARRPRLQASALLGLFAAAGVLARALGGPAWLTLLYAGLGVALASARLIPGSRRRTASVALPAQLTTVRRPRPASARRPAIGYVRIPAAGDRAALSAHHSELTAYAEEHGLELRTVVHDVERGPEHGRPALRWALERIADGDAQVLAVARLAHAAGSVAEVSALLRSLATGRRALVAIDLGLDTSTQTGLLASAVLERVGGWERARVVAPAPPPAPRAAQGPPAVADQPELQQRILALRAAGLSLQAIADRLNAEGVPTVRGGRMWRPSSVQRAAGYRPPPSPARGIEVPL